MTRSHKEELLSVLSNWLLDQTRPSPDHRVVEQLTGLFLSEWLEMQEQASEIEARVKKRKAIADAASEELKAIAPLEHVGLGIVNQWMADGERKAKIESLALKARQTSLEVSAADAELAKNIGERRAYAKRFLRNCLANIEEIENTPAFGPRAQGIVSEIASVIENEWRAHTDVVRKSVAAIKHNAVELGRIYAGQDGD
jgi:hypothetical protein